MPADQELIAVCTEFHLTSEEVDVLVARGMSSVSDVANYFESENNTSIAFRAQLFDEVAEWKGAGKGWILPALKKMWRSCVQLEGRRKGPITSAAIAGIDEPIDGPTHNSLLTNFKTCYSFSVPTSMLGADVLVSRMYRALQHRRLDQIQVKIYESADTVQMAIRTPAPIKLSGGHSIVSAEALKQNQPKQALAIDNPFHYLQGLQSYAWTLAVAGCHEVESLVPDTSQAGATKPGKAIMVSLQDMLDHWAKAQAFVLKWSSGKEKLEPSFLKKELQHHDEHIRAKWAEEFRKAATTRTLSQVINEAAMVADATNMWGKDYQHIGEYMWLLLEDDMLSKADARHEYEAALRFQSEALA